MSRSLLFANLARAVRIARLCDDEHVSTLDGIARVREAEIRSAARRQSRRDWLKTVGRTGVGAAGAALALPEHRVFAAGPPRASLDVGIVGAGLAGLACADALSARGVVARLYEASTRTGGRCWSLRGTFPGQVAERGGEFIDTLHKTMLGYVGRFKLSVEDVNKQPGEIVYFFDGRRVPEADVVDQLRDFVGAMRVDLRQLSNEVTALSHSPADSVLDHTSLQAYLEGQNATHTAAGPVAKAAIVAAYIAEYGLEPAEQSSLNFLHFIHADRRSKFTPFGVFSDERYHVLDGNDRIVQGLTQALVRAPEYGMTLAAVRRTSSGRVQLTFDTPGGTVYRTHDIVVLTIPFTVLRTVDLDAGLGLSIQKRDAIDLLGYGANAKMMIGFTSRPWAQTGGNGTSYSDLDHHQTTWETNPARATTARGMLTDYSGGLRGATLNMNPVQTEAEAFVQDLEQVFPGAAASVRRVNGDILAHLEHWPSNPLTLGSYTAYRPGQFTTIAGLEGQPAGSLFFAGEHTNSFYAFQGFMEGAALSGIDAADAILRAARRIG